jgi:hypothetical protein
MPEISLISKEIEAEKRLLDRIAGGTRITSCKTKLHQKVVLDLIKSKEE